MWSQPTAGVDYTIRCVYISISSWLLPKQWLPGANLFALSPKPGNAAHHFPINLCSSYAARLVNFTEQTLDLPTSRLTPLSRELTGRRGLCGPVVHSRGGRLLFITWVRPERGPGARKPEKEGAASFSAESVLAKDRRETLSKGLCSPAPGYITARFPRDVRLFCFSLQLHCSAPQKGSVCV